MILTHQYPMHLIPSIEAGKVGKIQPVEPLRKSEYTIIKIQQTSAPSFIQEIASRKRGRSDMSTSHNASKRRTTSPTGQSLTVTTPFGSPRYNSDDMTDKSDDLADSSDGMVNDAVQESGSSAHVSSFRSASYSSSEMHHQADNEHVIELSSVEHCMPRAYIRVCLAYRLTSPSQIEPALKQLNKFIHKTVNAKPYLAGFVVPRNKDRSTGPVEIRFTNEDYEEYPDVEVCDLCEDDGTIMDYNELDSLGLPPSRLHPDKVAKLPAAMADEKRAPVFRARANLVRGGLIVSFYLHHCISDGTGLGLLVTGSLTKDIFTFQKHINGESGEGPSIGERLTIFANHKTIVRKGLSWSSPNETIRDRKIMYNRLDAPAKLKNLPGRGCVLSFSDEVINQLREELSQRLLDTRLSTHDALHALIWRYMTRARMPIVRKTPSITTSRLLVPVNIRSRLDPPLSESYFGAAVDFAVAEFDLDLLVNNEMQTLANAAKAVKDAVRAVDEPYIRQAIALAMSSDPNIDVRDLLASNMNRVTGADMYITSWERLELYDATLGMGLGQPEWVRKPWSRDPGSCIILPRNPRKAQFEVVVQMTSIDMERLLNDQEFMRNVTRVID